MPSEDNEILHYSPLLALSILIHLLLLWMFLQIRFEKKTERPLAGESRISIFLGEADNGNSDGTPKGEEESEEEEEEDSSTPEEQTQPEKTEETVSEPEVSESVEETLDPVETLATVPDDLLAQVLGVGPSPETTQDFQSLLKARNKTSAPSTPSTRFSREKAFTSRSKKGRETGTSQNGGSGATEDAVELSLRWFANHQDRSNGSWDPTQFNSQCPCPEKGYITYHTGITALVLLCYSGAGYTHQEGPYRREIEKAIQFLLSQQNTAGRFAEQNMYNHTLALLALAEIYALTKDPKLKNPLQLGVLFAKQSQQPGGGWSYSATPNPSRNDSSIVGFMLMALITCHLAEIDVDPTLFQGIAQHFSEMTDPDGSVMYADVGDNASRGGMGMVAVGLYSRLALGYPEKGPLAQIQAQKLLQNLPDWNKASTLDNSMYYWYYGTLATYLAGKSTFSTWNSALKTTILKHQKREGHEKGSYDAIGKWGKHGGRLYATAMNTLCLEIYYKYSPNYLTHLPEFRNYWEKTKKIQPWERPIMGKKE